MNIYVLILRPSVAEDIESFCNTRVPANCHVSRVQADTLDDARRAGAGSLLGSIKSPAASEASRINGRKGGRPKKTIIPE